MSEAKLTREQIEQFRRVAKKYLQGIRVDEVCDLALQSLSQEAVRDEALEQGDKFMQAKLSGFNEGLEEAAKVCKEYGDSCLKNAAAPEIVADIQDMWRDMNLAAIRIAERIRALKREPNAAAIARCPDGLLCPRDYDRAQRTQQELNNPAPAAPDVASMVKRLEGRASGLDGGIYMYEADAALMRQAAAILSRLGQIIHCAERRKDCWPCLTCGAIQPLECKVHE